MESIVPILPLQESQEDSNGDNDMYYNYVLDFFFLYHLPWQCKSSIWMYGKYNYFSDLSFAWIVVSCH